MEVCVSVWTKFIAFIFYKHQIQTFSKADQCPLLVFFFNFIFIEFYDIFENKAQTNKDTGL